MAPVAPKMAPKIPKMAPKTAKITLKIPKMAPKMATKTPEMVSKIPMMALKIPKMARKIPKMAATIPKMAPKISNMAPKRLRCQKHRKPYRKLRFFGRFLKVKSLRRACKVVLWRSWCGLEGFKRATWTPCWLRVGINKASWSFRSAKHVSESLHAESNLRSDVLENRKFPNMCKNTS